MVEQMIKPSIAQYIKGTVLFEERAYVNKIALLVKGRVEVQGPGIRQVLSSGSFLGLQDAVIGRYSNTYKAIEDVVAFQFEVDGIDDVGRSITSNSDYCGLVVASLCKQVNVLLNNQEKLKELSVSSYQNVKKHYALYEQLVKESNYSGTPFKLMESIQEVMKVQENEKSKYYRELNSFPLESIKDFFSCGNYIVIHHMKELAQFIQEVAQVNHSLGNYVADIISIYINNTDECLFYRFAQLFLDTSEKETPACDRMEFLDELMNEIKHAQTLIESTTNKKIVFDRNKMKATYDAILSGDKEASAVINQEVHFTEEEIMEQLKNSLYQILEYSGVNHEIATVFEQQVTEFSDLTDKFATDDSSRSIRKHLAKHFYTIYQNVFLKAYHDINVPKVIQLFLDYGFMDEKLLTKEQLLQLWNLSLDTTGGKIKVFTIREWLTMVYEGRRAPSKNEFDLDYTETLRDLYKQKKITEEEMKVYKEDKERKLDYEIKNMFQYNNRVVNGKITTFVPILHKDMFVAELDRFLLNAQKINEAIEQIRAIDYSVFYREVSYVNKEVGIEKEYIMAEVFPEVILMPTVGTKEAMWQEISERKRDTPARFILPMFLEGSVEDALMRCCAKFRWELCRTMQGATWNNIKYKSLTSEYTDYIQFYRKNRELSEEKKEKLRLQILKCSNRSQEIFASDYESWVKGEALGGIRLNKVVRKIMATYCPFEKSLREKLMNQPIFAEAMAYFCREAEKKARELTLHYKSLQNNQITIPKELQHTLEFFQDK